MELIPNNFQSLTNFYRTGTSSKAVNRFMPTEIGKQLQFLSENSTTKIYAKCYARTKS